jgi:hypothetical protein
MATATAQTPQITHCPPMPAKNARFDEYVGARANHPVAAHAVAGGGFESTGIDFADYDRMSTKERKLAARRYGAPSWVLNDSTLRAVLVRYLELRAFTRAAPLSACLSESERLQRAQAKIVADIPKKDALLTKLAKEYMALKRRGTDPARLLKLGQLIEGLDSAIVMSRNIAGKVLMVAHLYYRTGLNCVEVGTECGIKPPHVRMLLLRLRSVAAELGYGPAPPRGDRLWKPRITCKGCGGPKPVGKGRGYCDACRKPRQREPRAVVIHAALPYLKTSPKPERHAAIVASAEFIVLFEKARARFRNPSRATCKHGHEICPANAHMADLRRTGKYYCNQCCIVYAARYNAKAKASLQRIDKV